MMRSQSIAGRHSSMPRCSPHMTRHIRLRRNCLQMANRSLHRVCGRRSNPRPGNNVPPRPKYPLCPGMRQAHSPVVMRPRCESANPPGTKQSDALATEQTYMPPTWNPKTAMPQPLLQMPAQSVPPAVRACETSRIVKHASLGRFLPPGRTVNQLLDS
jgi:hypothetical protein